MSIRQKVIAWQAQFALINSLLFLALASGYLVTLYPGDFYVLGHKASAVVIAFVVFSYVSYFGLLACLPALTILPGWWFKASQFCWLSIVSYCLMASLLIIDTHVYQLYHFHLNGLFFQFLFESWHGEIINLTWYECRDGLYQISGIAIFELGLAWILWTKCAWQSIWKKLVKWALIVIAMSLYISLMMLCFSSHSYINRIFFDNARIYPGYYSVFGFLLFKENGLVHLERRAEVELNQPRFKTPLLHYPLSTLHFGPLKQPYNVLIIVVDTWRADAVQPQWMPNLYRFAQTNLQFAHHISGGNATGPGIFSLFYGLPATYWQAFEAQHISPVLMDSFLAQHYQLGVFASAELHLPNFAESVFVKLPGLATHRFEATAEERDQGTTNDFLKALAQQKRPFFNFLYYDGVHNYCFSKKNRTPFTPVIPVCERSKLTSTSPVAPYLNRYLNSLLMVDQQLGQVFAGLVAQHLLEKTIVIITGDHGEELNDNQLGYWGHASNYSIAQIQTPFILHWPGKKAGVVTQQTSHFDVVPMLMNELLACQTSTKEYSVGLDMLKPMPVRPFLILGSYTDVAVLTPTKIMRIYSLGNVDITDLHAKPLWKATLDMPVLTQAFALTRRFYQFQNR